MTLSTATETARDIRLRYLDALILAAPPGPERHWLVRMKYSGAGLALLAGQEGVPHPELPPQRPTTPRQIQHEARAERFREQQSIRAMPRRRDPRATRQGVSAHD